MQRMAGRRGLNGPIVLCHVGGASSSVDALATVSITTARGPLFRPATATSKSVISAVSKQHILTHQPNKGIRSQTDLHVICDLEFW